MEREYQAKVVAVIGKELTKKEMFSVSRFSRCKDVASLLSEQEVIVKEVQTVAIVEVHNEKSENTDYKKMVVIGSDGSRYVTGSETAMREMMDIMDYMAEYDEAFDVQFVTRPSNNFKDRDFITVELL